jgi:hypothetical protein
MIRKLLQLLAIALALLTGSPTAANATTPAASPSQARSPLSLHRHLVRHRRNHRLGNTRRTGRALRRHGQPHIVRDVTGSVAALST